MSIDPSEIEFFGCANMPEADGLTVGGAVNFNRRISFADATVTGPVDYVSSSGSDTATKIIVGGRDSTGTIQTETKTLNGTTIVAGTQSWQRYLYAASSGEGANGPLGNPGGTAAVGDLAVIQHTRTVAGHTCQTGSANKSGVTPPIMKLQSGDGASATLGMVVRTTGGTGPNQIRRVIGLPATFGTDIIAVNANWTTVPDNTTTYDFAPGVIFEKANNAGQQTTGVIRHFATVASDVPGGSTRVYYEKIFGVNNDTTTSLTSAQIVKQIDPTGLYAGGGALDAAPTTAYNDTNTTTNRQTVPSTGVGTFTSGAAPQSFNAVGSALPAGTAPNAAGAQGVWLRLTLVAGMSPANTFADYRATGQTT